MQGVVTEVEAPSDSASLKRVEKTSEEPVVARKHGCALLMLLLLPTTALFAALYNAVRLAKLAVDGRVCRETRPMSRDSVHPCSRATASRLPCAASMNNFGTSSNTQTHSHTHTRTRTHWMRVSARANCNPRRDARSQFLVCVDHRTSAQNLCLLLGGQLEDGRGRVDALGEDAPPRGRR